MVKPLTLILFACATAFALPQGGGSAPSPNPPSSDKLVPPSNSGPTQYLDPTNIWERLKLLSKLPPEERWKYLYPGTPIPVPAEPNPPTKPDPPALINPPEKPKPTAKPNPPEKPKPTAKPNPPEKPKPTVKPNPPENPKPIEKPSPPAEIPKDQQLRNRFERHCNGAFDHADVWPSHFEGNDKTPDSATWACHWMDGDLGKGETKFHRIKGINTKYASYRFTVSWIDGCEATWDKQSVAHPMGHDRPDINCAHLLRHNYQHCNNKGAGGFTYVGCLRYEFRPE
ncbi:hypothetical protein jhhlp_005459 [Lomentospora prolificans]|uniref:SCP domain-containing protein n=1 Tax=Lomentospora prolificans TaxID=41688 RepID=A0A2N3N6V7_9PEZI|nr:hypothetical protein jhhlp_005459 [Lomentospora prolificans]